MGVGLAEAGAMEQWSGAIANIALGRYLTELAASELCRAGADVRVPLNPQTFVPRSTPL